MRFVHRSFNGLFLGEQSDPQDCLHSSPPHVTARELQSVELCWSAVSHGVVANASLLVAQGCCQSHKLDINFVLWYACQYYFLYVTTSSSIWLNVLYSSLFVFSVEHWLHWLVPFCLSADLGGILMYEDNGGFMATNYSRILSSWSWLPCYYNYYVPMLS